MAVTDCGGLRLTPDQPSEDDWAWGVLDKLTEHVWYMPTDKATAEYIEVEENALWQRRCERRLDEEGLPRQ